MCGRFALTLPQDAVRDLFHATPMPGVETLDRPRYNIRPTEKVLTVASDAEQGRLLRPMRWGFIPHWAKSPSDGPLLINARSETIAEKPAFRAACRERRCLIPADGFYEWKASAGPGKAPYWIAPTSDDLVAFAGVWQDWTSPQGDQLTTVAIVTCAANETLSPLHHRLPVAIPPDAFGLWLGEEGKGAATLMQPPAEDFYAFHAVSQRINKGGRTAPDDAELRVPVDEDAPERSDPPRLI